MPKRLYGKKDFSCCEESKRGRSGQEEEIHEEQQQENDNEDLVSGILAGDVVAHYHLELKLCKNAVIVLNENATAFFMRDFNLQKKTLWETRFVSLKRKGCRFSDDSEDDDLEMTWVYSCSCCKHRSDTVDALGSSVNLKHEEWLQLIPECIHVKVLKKAIVNFDSVYSLTPVNDEHSEEAADSDLEGNDSEGSDILPFLNVSRNIICAKPPSSSWGIITTSSLGMKCMTCACSNNCMHITFVNNSLEEELCPDFVAEFCDQCQLAGVPNHRRRVWKSKCLSYMEIPFDRPGMLNRLICNGLGQTIFSAVEEVEKCPFCNEESVVCDQMVKEVPFYTQYQQAKVGVYSALTSGCPHVIPFDGSQHGILNMGEFLIGHDVLRDYLFNFINGRMPLFTFYTCWKQRHVDTGHGEENMLSYYNFRHAWYSFLSLMAEDLDASFIRPICKETPPVVILDGTCLAFRRSYVPRHLMEKSGLEQSQRQTGSRFSERVMISHKKTRELVQRYCSNSQRRSASSAVLLFALSKYSPSLKIVIEWCISQYGESDLAPREVRLLLMSLAKPSPVCALLPATENMRLLLEQMISTDVKQQPQLLQSLQTLCSVLFNVVKTLKWNDGSLPEAFSGLLKDLWSKTSAPFQHADQNAPTEAASVAETDSFLESVSVWPHLPRLQDRGTYPMDSKSDRQSCRKLGKAHKTLLPGTVTLHCQHDICYGFEVMLQAESPNTIFSIVVLNRP